MIKDLREESKLTLLVCAEIFPHRPKMRHEGVKVAIL
jgi:hypothetical protein